MGRDLALAERGNVAIPVSMLAAGDAAEEASGLALMLHQFLEQTLEGSSEKRRLAPKLRGEAIVCAAEDETIRVLIRFCGDCIEVSDADARQPAGTASLTADFLSIAHLTSGQESPFALLAGRKLRVRFRPGELPFLLRMLAFMRSADAGASRLWLWRAVLAGVAVAVAIYILV